MSHAAFSQTGKGAGDGGPGVRCRRGPAVTMAKQEGTASCSHLLLKARQLVAQLFAQPSMLGGSSHESSKHGERLASFIFGV